MTLRTNCEPIFAAGGCSEPKAGSPLPGTLEDEAATTGRVAGANCTGERISIGAVKVSREEMMGVGWTRIEVRAHAPGLVAPPFETMSYARGELSSCSMVYERSSGRVVKVEWVEEEGSGPSQGVPRSALSLRELAYGGSAGSSDISLVAETARLGLNKWRRS
jgi:hypothetical protein